MHDLNDALDELRSVIPYAHSPSVRKLSKIATLLLAKNFILMQSNAIDELRRMLGYPACKSNEAQNAENDVGIDNGYNSGEKVVNPSNENRIVSYNGARGSKSEINVLNNKYSKSNNVIEEKNNVEQFDKAYKTGFTNRFSYDSFHNVNENGENEEKTNGSKNENTENFKTQKFLMNSFNQKTKFNVKSNTLYKTKNYTNSFSTYNHFQTDISKRENFFYDDKKTFFNKTTNEKLPTAKSDEAKEDKQVKCLESSLATKKPLFFLPHLPAAYPLQFYHNNIQQQLLMHQQQHLLQHAQMQSFLPSFHHHLHYNIQQPFIVNNHEQNKFSDNKNNELEYLDNFSKKTLGNELINYKNTSDRSSLKEIDQEAYNTPTYPTANNEEYDFDDDETN